MLVRIRNKKGLKTMQELKIESGQAGQRLDKFLHKCLPEAGSSFLYKMLRKKNITLNGKKAEGKELLQTGDVVRMYFAEETFLKFAGNNDQEAYLQAYREITDVSVIYETKDMTVLNKPAGILTQKAKDSDLSLNEWLIGYLLQSGSITSETLRSFKPSVCNRLDRNTSGLVLCGNTLSGTQQLSEMIRTRKLAKFYRTICVGELTEGAYLDGYLRKNARTNRVEISELSYINDEADMREATERASNIEGRDRRFRNAGEGINIRKENVAEDRTDGRLEDDKESRIQTAYHPIRSNQGFTLLEVELITGKPHQIRAHLASIGHSIIGDYKYGERAVNDRLKAKFGLEYQLLHAYRVVFPDENAGISEMARVTGINGVNGINGIELTAPYPELFERIAREMHLL